ncbi:hypothetical protein AI2795V1_4753 (plasmid) [Serratia marcescens]|uniref:antirestriction phage head protein DarA n=1 Tax=Serratia marcescens TaxID=615 RepID=UPI001DE875C6|nr:hypothetical protein [Serratia marcescens]CAE7798573.1 hypothetical protein AI2795V1_4753 [Serratia marcescens]CAH3933392.1 hypothetical protein AI2795V1_4753 [Serratia marcescens]
MSNPYHPMNGVLIVDRGDYDVRQVTDAEFASLNEGGGEDLMLESVTVEEVESAFIGDHLADPHRTAMFEAISTTKNRLSQTMRAFVRVLNSGLNGTGIKAGTDEAGTDDTGVSTAGGAEIGNVRKVAGIPVMAAKIPLTDGQSVSLLFHSPTADVKLKAQDVLVAFKFLLNKRDVTHVVAPIGGRDMSLNQTAQTLSNLIEKNSSKFSKSRDKHNKLKLDAEAAEFEAEKLESLAIDEMAKADEMAPQMADIDAQIEEYSASISRQTSENERLSSAIESLKAKKTQKQSPMPELGVSTGGTAATSGSYTVPLASIQTGAMNPTLKKAAVSGENPIWYSQSNGDNISFSGSITVNGVGPSPEAVAYKNKYKAAKTAGYQYTYFRISGLQGIYVFVKDGQVLTKAGFEAITVAEETEQPATTTAAAADDMDTDTSQCGALYYYGLKARPNWRPGGAVNTYDPEGFSASGIKTERSIGANDIRYGVAVYNSPLSADKVADYELVDLQYSQDEKEAFSNIELLKPLIGQLKGREPHATSQDFLRNYLTRSGANATELPDGLSLGTIVKNLRTAGLAQRKSAEGVLETIFNEVPPASPLAPPETKTPGAPIPSPELDIPPSPAGEPPPVLTPSENEVDTNANKAVEFLKATLSLQTSDMDEIREARGNTRQAVGALANAGIYDEHESLVNDVAQHLSDLLVAIQREGAAA